jgi:dTDP-4-amino-4,6-dideoxygalactose transaminase
MTTQQTNQRALPSDADRTGRTFGAEETALLSQVIESGTLNCTKGTVVRELEAEFARHCGTSFARAVNSGTAAVHAAVAAIDPEPGDEIITTAITDMGALTPILYQTAIPVFADVDPTTFNITAETIEPRITERTRAIIVTHLFGYPCDMDPILELAASRNIPVIEDAAQAFGTVYKGRPAGTMGAIGCFSFQQGKHMTSGEGGIVVSNDESYSRRMNLFVDKAWGYGDSNPDHYFLALNYRLSELQGAVALAQLRKLKDCIAARVATASLMDELIDGVPGVAKPATSAEMKHTYWKYCLRIDPAVINGGVDAFSKQLKECGVWSAPRYIQKPAFMCEVFRDQNTFGKSGFPFRGPHRKGLPPVEYRPEEYPGIDEALSRICVLPWNEKYTEDDVRFVADAILQTAEELS